MANVLVEQFYSMHEDLPGIEPFVEYRGDIVLAQSTFESSQGPDVVSADAYLQNGADGKKPKAEFLASKVTADPAVVEVEPLYHFPAEQLPSHDPMLDPFESPLLDDLED